MREVVHQGNNTLFLFLLKSRMVGDKLLCSIAKHACDLSTLGKGKCIFSMCYYLGIGLESLVECLKCFGLRPG
jgi:hypothetical protein